MFSSTNMTPVIGVSMRLLRTKHKTFSSRVLNHPFHSSCAVGNQTGTNDLKLRQAQIMAKGLPKKKPIEGVQHVILVASGKGGVGKSTSAVNIAAALKVEEPNKQVGLLDADVFGPSVPLMMNLDDSPLLDENNLMVPLQNYGVKCMSMGFLVNKDAPVIWRGLMVMQALDRLLRQVAWDPVDYLIVDTPPGTGDTHLSLVQNIPVSGVLLVTIPQTAALQVTQRGANMFKKLDVPILGVLLNMSSVECPKCSNNVSLHSKFSETIIQELGVSILEDIPLDNTISHGSDNGVPVVISHPDGAVATAYRKVARKIVQYLSERSIGQQ